MSSPTDMGSLTNAVMAFAELSQLSLLAGGGEPVTMLEERSCMMKIATGVSVVIVSVTEASMYFVICSGTSATAPHELSAGGRVVPASLICRMPPFSPVPFAPATLDAPPALDFAPVEDFPPEP